MKRFLLAPALFIVLALTTIAVTDSPHEKEMKDAALFTPSEIKWMDGPASLPKGAKMAVLEGDPAKEGPFVFRVKLPDGYRVPPHTHPKTERVTVIAGTLNFGSSD